jgi:hypothetical protein
LGEINSLNQPPQGIFSGKEESSFCEQKEAKKLHPFEAEGQGVHAANGIKVFWFFFSKKNRFLALSGLIRSAGRVARRGG